METNEQNMSHEEAEAKEIAKNNEVLNEVLTVLNQHITSAVRAWECLQDALVARFLPPAYGVGNIARRTDEIEKLGVIETIQLAAEELARQGTPKGRERLTIGYNNCASNDPCAICGQRSDPSVPLAIYEQGTYAVVCDVCARKRAPELYYLLQYYYDQAPAIQSEEYDRWMLSVLQKQDEEKAKALAVVSPDGSWSF